MTFSRIVRAGSAAVVLALGPASALAAPVAPQDPHDSRACNACRCEMHRDRDEKRADEKPQPQARRNRSTAEAFLQQVWTAP